VEYEHFEGLNMAHNEACGCREYQELSRRQFMAVSGGAAIAMTAPAWLPRVALAQDHRGAQRDVIISIYQRGASDGLSMVVPYQEPAYYSNRPTLAVPAPGSAQPGEAIDLDGFFGLHPALAPLLTAYNNDHLLFVHASGSTDTSRSHFDAQKLMEVGNVTGPQYSTGWLGRHLYSVAPMLPTALLRAVGISTGLQRTLIGGPKTLPIPDLDNFGLSGFASTIAARQTALNDLYNLVGDPLRATATTTIQTIDLLNTINFAGYVPAGGATYPAGAFGTALKSSAALIKAQVGVEAIAIDIGGWDTHENQGTNNTGTLFGLLAQLASGLAAFYTDMITGSNPTFSLVCMSEFGRRLLENGSFGTDHGHGNLMIAMGNCISGGRVMAQWPGLDPGELYQQRDLQVTIDYRDILWEILNRRAGSTSLEYIFPGYAPVNRNATTC
jgi:uncharacterized protein (DUF1501 family)